MKKFIIVDQSLCSLQGHHYECSLSVAEAAAREGYQPIVLANRVLERSLLSGEIEIIPVFEVDWFNQPVLSDSQKDNPVGSKVGKTIARVKDFFVNDGEPENSQNFLLYSLRLTYPKLSKLIEKIEGSLERLNQGFHQDLKLLSYIPFANTLWRSLKIILGLVSFLGELISKIIYKNLNYLKKNERKIVSFTETLTQELPKLSLTDQDHIFIHTLGIEQLEELYHWLANSDRSSMPTYHILLRRDTKDPLVLNAQGMGLKNCLQACYDSQLWPSKIRFYTDTKDLVNRHNLLSPVQFCQIPIPFRQEKLTFPVLPLINSTIHIVYLGDARSEKGYQYLPNLIATLWTDYIQPTKVKFTIQSNYNVQGREAQILEAKLILSQYPDSKVRLIDQPMSPNDYYQLLNSADIIVLPYNPQNYQRTSGVLTEALAAGKPVVVPEGSWLAQQVDESRASIYNDPQELPQAVIRLIDNLSSFTEAAGKFSVNWREQQSPDRLIQCLLNPPNFEINLPIKPSISLEKLIPENPKILVLMAGKSVISSVDDISKSVDALCYFCQCGYQVYGILYGENDNLDQKQWDDFSQSVKAATQGYGLQKVWILEPQYNQGKPKDCSTEQYQRYIEDSYHKRSTVFKTWIESHYLAIPADLSKFLQTINIDLIYLDSLLYWPCLKNLGLDQKNVIGEVDQLYAYHSALVNHRELDTQELAWEIYLLKQCKVLLTSKNYLAEKVQELTQNPRIYAFELLNINTNLWTSYTHSLNQTCLDILGTKALPLSNFKPNPKIAILYPWGDIQERRSGASQRTGLLLDYFREQSYETRLYTIGQQKKLWSEGVFYEYYEPYFEQAELVKKVYQDAYRSWDEYLKLIDNDLDCNFPKNQDHWLPWIYYQFRFDPSFKNWLEKITDWADVVILEYPFWGYLLGEICQRKKIRLLLTAHDILAKNLLLETRLGQIALGEELQALKQADYAITLTPDDQAFFANYDINSYCVPIAIDTQKIEQQGLNDFSSLATILDIPDSQIRPFCLFVGSQHQPNIEAVRQIRHWSQSGSLNFDFVIVGGCGEPERGKNFLSLGKVSETALIGLYQQAVIILAPVTAGTGMSVKILEALAYGKVILGTTISFRGYPVESGVNCIIYDRLDEYPQKIEQLLQQPEELKLIGQKAKEFAQAYDYRQLYKTYLDLIL